MPGSAFTPYSLDLHERVALGIQTAIQTTLCPLPDPASGSYTIGTAQIYKQDRPIPEVGCMFPCVIISIQEEIEEDDEAMGFEDDGAWFPCRLQIVNRLDAWDPKHDPAVKYWRKLIIDLFHGARSLPDCGEVWDVWVQRRPIFNENLPALEYLTSDLVVRARAIWQRAH